MRLCQLNPLHSDQKEALPGGDSGDHGADGTISLTRDLTGSLPPYAILSHTWSTLPDEEVTFEDLSAFQGGVGFEDEKVSGEAGYEKGKVVGKSGWRKLEFCAAQTKKLGSRDMNTVGGGRRSGKNEERQPTVRHFWLDTCCIDRANLVELSEAITSMWRWYRGSERCFVYLEDVDVHNGLAARQEWEEMFRRSRWWTRGWTLQELLAPKKVDFFSRDGQRLGDKRSLEGLIHEITGIPLGALRGEDLSQFPVEERLRWRTGRNTKKIEDKAYCLLGIFDVSMSLRYGEGEKAVTRLEAKVKSMSKVEKEPPENPPQVEMKREAADKALINWLAPARPEGIHAKVAASRHPDTGLAFTEGVYRSWLTGESSRGSMMWITGKTGTGKTTLFSHIVDKTKALAHGRRNAHVLDSTHAFVTNTPVAYHYCAFSVPESQQPLNVLGSFAVQFSAWRPSMLDDFQRFYDRTNSRNGEKMLQVSELEDVIVRHMKTFKKVVILLDALNESDDFIDTLSVLNRLLKQLPNLQVLLTSTRSALTAGAARWPHTIEILMKPDEDIRAFVEAHLAADGALSHLSPDCHETIRATLAENADQTFRWVALTLDNLCRQRTGKAVLKALAQMPAGLNNTYASMLLSIPTMDRPIAREALMWLSFALRPMTLLALSEAAVLEDGDTTLNQDSRLRQPEVLLEICHGFIEHDTSSGEVKLAHSSVKEYLLSDHVRSIDGDAFFALDAEQGNQTLMHKCLTYLMFDDFTPGVALGPGAVTRRQRDFPLLEYAAFYWGLHASFATADSWTLAHQFFATRSLPRAGNYGAWVSCLIPESHPGLAMSTQPLYYAASFGILPLVRALLTTSSPPVDMEAPGGRYRSTALQVATYRGRKAVSDCLFVAGADFWTPDHGSGAPAWFWVQANGWRDMLEAMIKKKPDIKQHVLWTAAVDLRVKRMLK